MNRRELSTDRVTVGSFWVNEEKGLVREITAPNWDGNVHWRSYWLADGRPTGDRLICSIDHILRWSDREAKAEEAARMQRQSGQALEVARENRLIEIALSSASDDQLLDEIRRRGYRVSGRRAAQSGRRTGRGKVNMSTAALAPPGIETLAELLESLGRISPTRVRMQPLPGTATEADVLAAHAVDKPLCELVDGVVVEKPMGYEESRLASAIIHALFEFLNLHDLGTVAGEAGMMRLREGLVRIPDVSFVRWQRSPTCPAAASATRSDSDCLPGR